MPVQNITIPTTEPVFIMSRYLPDKIDIITMCRAAEAVSGQGSIKGAYGDGGLWRVYPKTDVARALLLSQGFTVNRQRVQPEAVNPFILKGTDSEIPATRLSVGPLSFSYSDEFIIRNLESLGFRLRSKLMMENERLSDRSLSDWANGKRFVWVDLPKTPPKEFVKMGPLQKVKLFYREMREQRIKCHSCQQYGHKAADCTNEPVCFACGEVGHKRDNPICRHFNPPPPPAWEPDEGLGPKCSRCLEHGHEAFECFNSVVCWECNQRGHKKGDPVCDVVQARAREGGASVPSPGEGDDMGAESDHGGDASGEEDEYSSEEDEDDEGEEGENEEEGEGEDDEGEEGESEKEKDDSANLEGDLSADESESEFMDADDKHDVTYDLHPQEAATEGGPDTSADCDRYIITDSISPAKVDEVQGESSGNEAPKVMSQIGDIDEVNENKTGSEKMYVNKLFSEYEFSDDEITEDDNGINNEVKQDKKEKKKKLSYVEALLSDPSDTEEGSSGIKTRSRRQKKAQVKDSGKSSGKNLVQTQLSFKGDDKLKKRGVPASSPDADATGLKMKNQKLMM